MSTKRDLRDDRGALGPMITILVVAIVALAGLVVDAGGILAGNRQVYDAANQAAQAGSQKVDQDQLRSGDPLPQLDQSEAHSAAMSYLAAVGVSGSASVAGDEITVTASKTVHMQILGMLGVPPREVTGTASARAVRGVNNAET